MLGKWRASGIYVPGLMCIIFPDVPFILSFYLPPQPFQCYPIIYLAWHSSPFFLPFTLRPPLQRSPPNLCSPLLSCSPPSPSYPSSHQLHPSFFGSFGFVSHSVGWTDTGARGWWEGGGGFEEKCREGERKGISESWEENVKKDVGLRWSFCTEVK